MALLINQKYHENLRDSTDQGKTRMITGYRVAIILRISRFPSEVVTNQKTLQFGRPTYLNP